VSSETSPGSTSGQYTTDGDCVGCGKKVQANARVMHPRYCAGGATPLPTSSASAQHASALSPAAEPQYDRAGVCRDCGRPVDADVRAMHPRYCAATTSETEEYRNHDNSEKATVLSTSSFREELRQCLMNEFPGVYPNLDKIIQVVAPEILRGAAFVSWAPSLPVDTSTSLLVSTRSVTSIKTGMFKPKANWSVPIGVLKDVWSARATFNGVLEDRLCVETISGEKESFTFGFYNPSAGENHLAEAAQRRAQSTVNRIAQLMSGPRESLASQLGDAAQDDPVKAVLQRFLAELSGLTGSDSIGTPFGEGAGLELARSAAQRCFPNMDLARSAGLRIAISLITEEAIDSDLVSALMGADSMNGSGLAPAQAEAARSLGGAAMSFLGQLNEVGANMWELWRANDEVAEEFLCWHAVAWGRLITVGKVPLL
jgi:hypothetical protein